MNFNSAQSIIFNAPSPLPNFIYRKEIALDIEKYTKSAHSCICNFYGLPGAGKTSLAKDFVKINQQRYDYILWINFTSNLDFQLLEFILQWNNLVKDYQIDKIYQTSETSTKVLEKWLPLQKNKKWLIVLDDLDDDNCKLIQLLKNNSNFSIIITSRKRYIENAINVSIMTKQESINLLRTYDLNNQDAEKIFQALHGHPLALYQAAKMIKRISTLSVDTYIKMLIEKKDTLIKLTTYNHNKYLSNYQYTYFSALILSINELEKDHKTFNFLKYLCLLGEQIPKQKFLEEIIIQLGYDKDELHEILLKLLDYGFINENTKSHSYIIHGLIRQQLLSQMNRDEQEKYLTSLAKIFNKKFLVDYQDLENLMTNHLEVYGYAKSLVLYSQDKKIISPEIFALSILTTHLGTFFKNEFKFSDDLVPKLMDLYKKKFTNNINNLVKARLYFTYGNIISDKSMQEYFVYSNKAIDFLNKEINIHQMEIFFISLISYSDYYIDLGEINKLLIKLKKLKFSVKSFNKPFYYNLYYGCLSLAENYKGEYYQALNSIYNAEKYKSNLITSFQKVQILLEIEKYQESYELAKKLSQDFLTISDTVYTYKLMLLDFIKIHNLIKLNNMNLAKKISHTSLKKLERFKLIRTTANNLFGYAYFVMSEFYQMTKEYNKAQLFLEQAEAEYEKVYKIKELDSISKVYEAFIKLAINTNDYPLAQEYFKKQIKYYGWNYFRTLKIIHEFDKNNIDLPISNQ